MKNNNDSILSNKLMVALVAVAVLALISISVSLVLLNQVATQNTELASDHQMVEAEAETPVAEVGSEAAPPAEPEPEPVVEPEQVAETKPKAAAPVKQATKPAEEVIYHETIEDAKRLGEEGWEEYFGTSSIPASPTVFDEKIAGTSTHTPSGVNTNPSSRSGQDAWRMNLN